MSTQPIGAARLAARFAGRKAQNQAAFIAYIMGGDPDVKTAQKLLDGLPAAGADVIELGLPFTDPMADGPAIQAAALRALKAGVRTKAVLAMAAKFRKKDVTTPLIVMGYYNPIHHMGCGAFTDACVEAGVDGAIIVDLPPEEDAALRAAFDEAGLALIRLATPTTDDQRLPTVVAGTSGFVYYVSVAGITGALVPEADPVARAVARIRTASGLPVAVGFGVRTPEKAAQIARVADGVVVGSAIVDAMAQKGVEEALALTQCLSGAVHNARSESTS
ncbi:MAG: tryptophan synthase subunit alpha [Robiginitomaculum sp.]|nr:tryptophan synthase subunit alpha [Robiginitomaculum sp.]MDQ7076705.1 tryptophan synthase subunit alpha [Robiginitomaculum sp.]